MGWNAAEQHKTNINQCFHYMSGRWAGISSEHGTSLTPAHPTESARTWENFGMCKKICRKKDRGSRLRRRSEGLGLQRREPTEFGDWPSRPRRHDRTHSFHLHAMQCWMRCHRAVAGRKAGRSTGRLTSPCQPGGPLRTGGAAGGKRQPRWTAPASDMEGQSYQLGQGRCTGCKASGRHHRAPWSGKRGDAAVRPAADRGLLYR